MNKKLIQLVKYRSEIDKIDNNLLKLVAKRFFIAKKIALYKKMKKMPIYDRKREKLALQKRIDIGAKLNIKANFIKVLFKSIFKESRNYQRKVLK